MTLFLDLFWLAALVLGAPLIAWKLATVPRWRTGLLERFGLRLPRPRTSKPLIWVHAVSVGEVGAARPLVRELERLLPDHEVAISTITSTGLDVARRHFPDNLTFFYPVDVSFCVRRIMNALRPRLIVLVELELWPTFLTIAHRGRIPIVIVNGRISERSFRRYRFVSGLLTRPLSRCCAQNEEYAQRFRGLGIPPERVTVTGNLKYDTPALDASLDAATRELRARLGIASGARVIVCGSTHPSEERTAVEAWRALRTELPGLRLVVAPRHTERVPQVVDEIEKAGERAIRKTEIDRRNGSSTSAGTNGVAEPVIVVDTLGELSRIYSVADVVFVGGSLIPHGGQNMLEPASLGKPVVFGPHVRNFQAIADALSSSGGAEVVADAAALEGTLRRLLADPGRAAEMGEKGRAFVSRHRGAAARTAEVLRQVLRDPPLPAVPPTRDPALAVH